MRSSQPIFESFYAIPSRNGLTKPKKVRGKGVKFLNMGELFSHRRIYQLEMDRAPVTEKEKNTSLLEPGDLLFARQSIVPSGAGKCSIFLGDTEEVTFDSHLIRVRLDKNRCDPLFAFYYFESNIGRSSVDTIIDYGAGISGIKGSDLRKLPVAFPPVKQQREIAAVLEVLDEKIELNHKMAATLEAMARALYRSWYVDFDPVHARSQGLVPAHMGQAISALFPDGFGDDGLPEGWRLVPYLEAVEIISGGTPKTSVPEYWDGDIPWFSVVDAPSEGQVFVVRTQKKITPEGFNKCSAKPISRGTTIISARGTVGKLAMAGRDMTFNQSCYGLKGLRPESDAFTYFTTERVVEQLKNMAHGSVFSTITRKTFESVQIVECPEPILREFENQVGSLLDRMHSLVLENQTLTTLRNTLLPKLMSGELGVNDVLEHAEEAI